MKEVFFKKIYFSIVVSFVSSQFCGSISTNSCIDIDFSQLIENYVDDANGNKVLRSENLWQIDDALATKSEPVLVYFILFYYMKIL